MMASPSTSMLVKARLTLTDSEMPRKLISATTSRKATATSTTGSSTNSDR